MIADFQRTQLWYTAKRHTGQKLRQYSDAQVFGVGALLGGAALSYSLPSASASPDSSSASADVLKMKARRAGGPPPRAGEVRRGGVVSRGWRSQRSAAAQKKTSRSRRVTFALAADD